MKITIEAETDHEKAQMPEPVVYPLCFQALVAVVSVSGASGHFHGDQEFLIEVAKHIKRRIENVRTRNPE